MPPSSQISTSVAIGGGIAGTTLGVNVPNPKDVFNVKTWGAAGRPGVDDSDVFNACIAAAIAAEAEVYVPGVFNYYEVNKPLIATLGDAQMFSMRGDGMRSLIYSTAPAGDILTVDGTGSIQGRTAPNLQGFALAGSAATRDGLVINFSHRGIIKNVFVVGSPGWAWNFKGCILNTILGGGGSINVGAIGNIPQQPLPKGMLRLGSGSIFGGSNANAFIGSSWEGSQRPQKVITGATNATPIVIAAAAHGMSTGDVTAISGVLGNTAANDAWIVTVVDADHFSLDGSIGNGAYAGGGLVDPGVGIHIQSTTNSYGNTFIGGTAENNNVGALLGPLCTINNFMGTDITSNYKKDWKDRGANNTYINSGAGGAIASFGYGANFNGPVQVLGPNGQFVVDPTYGLRFNNALHNLLRLLDNRSVLVGDGALATAATDGFLYIPTSAGPPTGVPSANAGLVPIHYDSTNNQFYVYNGAWKKVALV